MKVKAFFTGIFLMATIAGMTMPLYKVVVPQAVKEAFASRFPNAQNVKWEIENTDEYEAEFKLDKKEMSANFKADGTWLETEMEIKTSALPAAIKAAISSQFAGYELEEAAQVENPGQALAYEVELENEATDSTLEVLFDVDGKVLSQKVEQETEDDDKD